MNALADKVHQTRSAMPANWRATATYVGMIVTLCVYAQQGYAFGCVGLSVYVCVCVLTYMYVAN